MQVLLRLATAIVWIVLLVAAFIFTSVILAVAAIVALMLWGWIMWRTRHLRRAVTRAAEEGEHVVIEGEYAVERENTRTKDPL